MTNKKISALTAATTPLAGTEVLPIVQSGVTVNTTPAAITGAGLYAGSFTTLRSNRVGAAQYIQQSVSGGNAYLDVVNDANTSDVSLLIRKKNTGTALITRLTIDDNGTIFEGNLTPSTAAKGINFTANTPQAGMTSQLLNWYEEGTFTATLTASITPPTTPVTTTATYTVVGRLVTIQVGFFNANTTGAVGSIEITGMPFTAASTFSVGSAAIDFGAASPVSYISSGTTKILLYASNTLVGIPIVASAGRYVVASISYLK